MAATSLADGCSGDMRPRFAFRIALASVLVMAVAVGLGGTGSASTTPTCHPKRSHTVIETKTARVFTQRRSGRERVYGCLLKARRPYLLVSLLPDENPFVSLAGAYVA